jgi:hypothetical protein
MGSTCWVAAALLVTVTAPIAAQTDFFNTDAGRPVRIEDAYATERFAFDVQLAPLRWERLRGGIWAWSVEPEIGYGILPRTQIEVGVRVRGTLNGAAAMPAGVAGIDIGVFHNLNTETLSLPAMAVHANVLLPAGRYAPRRAFPAAGIIITRSLPVARVHVNAQVAGGRASDVVESSDAFRWLAGIAIDRTWPLRSLLVTADLFAARPLHEGQPEWTAEAGFRKQLSPRMAVDLGLGRRFTGTPAWTITIGTAYAFAVRSLLPQRNSAEVIP